MHALRIVDLSTWDGDENAQNRVRLRYTHSLFGDPEEIKTVELTSLETMRAMTEAECSIVLIMCHYIAEKLKKHVTIPFESDDVRVAYKGCAMNRVWRISFRCEEDGTRHCYNLYEKDMRIESIPDSHAFLFHH